jgi:hypothetical protein
MSVIRRREFITLLGGAAVAWPFAARAQQTRAAPVVGLVSIAASAADAGNFRGFLEQMRELGYVDGVNIAFDKRFAGGREELIEGYVADLVRRPVDIIVVTGTRESLAAKQATSSIPIITIVHPDPIGLGLAQSLARPGGNVTGLTTMDLDIYGKRLELLRQAVPGLRKAAILVSPATGLARRGPPRCTRMHGPSGSLSMSWKPTRPILTKHCRTSSRPGRRGSWSPPTASSSRIANSLSTARSSTVCRDYLHIGCRRRLAA